MPMEAPVARMTAPHPGKGRRASHEEKMKPGGGARFRERRLRCGYIASTARAGAEICAGVVHVRLYVSRQQSVPKERGYERKPGEQLEGQWRIPGHGFNCYCNVKTKRLVNGYDLFC